MRRTLPPVTITGLVAGSWLLWRPGRLPAAAPERPDGGVAVVIPARDEAERLPRLLASLAAQTLRPDQLVVVDDHSTDGTGALAAAAGATVVTPPGPPPPGWLGKPWACHAGVAATTAGVLVLLDADVTLAPDGLARLIAAHRSGGGLLSVAPSHRTEALYEQLSAVCSVVSMMGTGAFCGPPGVPTRMAYGPCMVLSRSTYERIEGHAHPEVRGQIAEDVAMARRVAAAGLPVRILSGADTVAYRMYPGGLRQLADGWTKMLAGGAARSPAVPAAVTVLWVAGALRAAGRGARALAPGRHRSGPRGRATDVAVYAAWAAHMAWAARRAGRWRSLTPVAFPVPLAAFVALTARSAARGALRRPTAWRGRLVRDLHAGRP